MMICFVYPDSSVVCIAASLVSRFSRIMLLFGDLVSWSDHFNTS